MPVSENCKKELINLQLFLDIKLNLSGYLPSRKQGSTLPKLVFLRKLFQMWPTQHLWSKQEQIILLSLNVLCRLNYSTKYTQKGIIQLFKYKWMLQLEVLYA